MAAGGNMAVSSAKFLYRSKRSRNGLNDAKEKANYVISVRLNPNSRES